MFTNSLGDTLIYVPPEDNMQTSKSPFLPCSQLPHAVFIRLITKDHLLKVTSTNSLKISLMFMKNQPSWKKA